MKKIYLLFAAVFVFCNFSSKSAKVGQQTLSIMGGNSYPVYGAWVSENRGYDESYYAAISQEYRFKKHTSLGLELNYHFNHKDNETKRREIKILNITPYLKFSADSIIGFVPFLVIGAGISFVNYDDDITVPDVDDSTKRYPVVNIGAGVMYEFSNSFEIGFDLRYQYIIKSGIKINNIIPTAKLSYTFGKCS
jgi:opacity protein-like surface antigen